MKKTLIALFALAACAQALETATYDNLLSTTDGWTNGSVRGRNTFVFDTTAQTLDLNGSNWGQEYAYTSLPHAIMATPDEALSFTCTISVDTNWDQAFSMYLVGTNQTIVLGTKYKSGNLNFGISDVVTAAAGYGFGDWQNAQGYQVVTTQAPVSGSLDGLYSSAPVTLNISGKTVYNSSSETYSLVVDCNGSTATYDLGSLVNVTAVGFTADGGANIHNGTIGGLSLTGVTPEPATATLSLLALAGLAARRRRH